MAVFNTSLAPVTQISTILLGSSTLTVANVVCTLANTEYTYTFPSDTKKYKLRARGLSKIQIADSTGNTNTTFFTIFPGETIEDDILTTSITIYFQTSYAAETIEILSWA